MQNHLRSAALLLHSQLAGTVRFCDLQGRRPILWGNPIICLFIMTRLLKRRWRGVGRRSCCCCRGGSGSALWTRCSRAFCQPPGTRTTGGQSCACHPLFQAGRRLIASLCACIPTPKLLSEHSSQTDRLMVRLTVQSGTLVRTPSTGPSPLRLALRASRRPTQRKGR